MKSLTDERKARLKEAETLGRRQESEVLIFSVKISNILIITSINHFVKIKVSFLSRWQLPRVLLELGLVWPPGSISGSSSFLLPLSLPLLSISTSSHCHCYHQLCHCHLWPTCSTLRQFIIISKVTWMQVTLLSRTRGDRARQYARMAVARRQNLMQRQRPHIIFITIVVVILMILHNFRRQAQQRKRLVCELKAVERELKAVEVFTQLIFLATFWFHIIVLLNCPLYWSSSPWSLSGTPEGGQPVSRCVLTLFATVLWNLWKGTVVEYMQSRR